MKLSRCIEKKNVTDGLKLQVPGFAWDRKVYCETLKEISPRN